MCFLDTFDITSLQPHLLSSILINLHASRYLIILDIGVDEYVLLLPRVNLLLCFGLHLLFLLLGRTAALIFNQPLRMHEDPLVDDHEVQLSQLNGRISRVQQRDPETLDPGLGALSQALAHADFGLGELGTGLRVAHG